MQPHAYVQLPRPQHCSELPRMLNGHDRTVVGVQDAQESRQNSREHEHCLTSILHLECHRLRMVLNGCDEGSNSRPDGAKLPPEAQPCNSKSATYERRTHCGGQIKLSADRAHVNILCIHTSFNNKQHTAKIDLFDCAGTKFRSSQWCTSSWTVSRAV